MGIKECDMRKYERMRTRLHAEEEEDTNQCRTVRMLIIIRSDSSHEEKVPEGKGSRDF
jgi:hypothetical protein